MTIGYVPTGEVAVASQVISGTPTNVAPDDVYSNVGLASPYSLV